MLYIGEIFYIHIWFSVLLSQFGDSVNLKRHSTIDIVACQHWYFFVVCFISVCSLLCWCAIRHSSSLVMNFLSGTAFSAWQGMNLWRYWIIPDSLCSSVLLPGLLSWSVADTFSWPILTPFAVIFCHRNSSFLENTFVFVEFSTYFMLRVHDPFSVFSRLLAGFYTHKDVIHQVGCILHAFEQPGDNLVEHIRCCGGCKWHSRKQYLPHEVRKAKYFFVHS